MDTANLPPLPEQICFVEEQQNEEEETEELDVLMEDGTPLPSRLHLLVAEKICELVAQGHSEVYTVRKQLRRFVEREMFKTEEVPERHNLCYFPTVNDIKNHIHEAQKALQMTAGPLATSDTEWKAEANNLLPETLTLALTPATVGETRQ